MRPFPMVKKDKRLSFLIYAQAEAAWAKGTLRCSLAGVFFKPAISILSQSSRQL